MLQAKFYGDPNIGLYTRACDKFCLVGNFLSEKDREKVENCLKVKVRKCLVADTEFVGLFSVVNSNGILLSKIVTGEELKIFKQIAQETGINLEVIDSKFTAIGNLVLCNDSGAVVSKLLRKIDVQKIEDSLDVEILQMRIGDVDIVGSSGVATNRGCLLHRDSTEDEIRVVSELLKVEADTGTVNFGSPFVSSGVIVNSKGALIGDKTTPPEIQRIIDALKLE